MPRLFGTDGIRGIANRYPITAEMGIRFGRAVVKFCGKRPFIITGRDTRISGQMLEFSIISGILSSGGDVLSCGIIPTPAVAYLVKELKADAGIVISASHNPWEYNGFKAFSRTGEKLSEKDEECIEEIMEKGYEGETIGEVKTEESVHEKYQDFLIRSVPKDTSFSDIKAVIDCANGATYRIAPSVFQRLGISLDVIFASPDGKNINKGCGSEHPERLKREVIEKKADVGFAFDGDGDRVLAVDEKGNILSGDHLIAIFALFLKEKGELKRPAVVSTVMSNMGLTKLLKDLGIRHIRTAVGDRNVSEMMKKEGAILGGEESGHIIFMNYHTTGDGLLSAIQLLCAMKFFEKPLSELQKIMRPFPQVKRNVEVREKKDLSEIPELNALIERIKKELSEKGRVLVRYSGTEPVCRIMVEGEDEEKIKGYAEEISEVIRRKLGK